MEEINNFQQEPDENLYQAWERFKELLMKCPQHYLTEMHETAADAKVTIQEMAEYSQKWHNGKSRSRSTETSDGLAAIQEQFNNLGREIKKVNEKVYAAQVGCEQCNGPCYTKDYLLKLERKTLEEAYYTLSMEDTLSKFVLLERGFGSLPSSTEAILRDQFNSISTTIKANSCPICHIGSSEYAVSTGRNRTLMYETIKMTILFPSHLNGYYYKEKNGSYGPQFLKAYSEASQSIPRKEKDQGSFTLPCFIHNVCFDSTFVDLGASVSVIPLSTYLNLGLGELAHTKLTVELEDMTVKYPKGIAKTCSGLRRGLCLICENNQNSLNDSLSISENSSQSPSHINHHCCYECGDPLDGIFCHQCTCESCGKESNEFIKSSVENLVPNPSKSKGEHECDVPACDDFTTFSNLLFDVDDDFSSSNDESFFDEDISKKIYSNPLFDEEIISMKIDPHHFNAESDLIESLLNQDSSIISSSLKIDFLPDEFVGELIFLKSIPPGIDKAD
uniref:Retrotransposon gag domain-containing protein n=1 Tax=Tanacetum cinerariifolium TaxID=118510 RepID=A0A699GVP0_TANCI|nr:hypothetical protein [Tanacetum cinerariifolium]